MVHSVEASTQEYNIIDTNLREVDTYEILGMQWYTLLAVGIITATGVALLATTAIPFEIVIFSTVALIGVVLLIENCFSDVIRGADSRINPQHFRAITNIEDHIEEPPAHIQLNQLLEIFDRINFEEQFFGNEGEAVQYDNEGNPIRNLREDYIDPDSINDDGGRSIGRAGARNQIERWIGHINGQGDGISGVPHNSGERDRYYASLEKFLKWQIHTILELQTDLVARNPDDLSDEEILERDGQVKAWNKAAQAVLRMSVAFGHCGGRVMAEAIETYGIIVTNDEQDAFEKQIESKLHDLRRSFLHDVARETHPDSGIFHSHVVLKYLEILGRTRGIMGGVAASYDDPYSQSVSSRDAYRLFDQRYTRDKIIEFIRDGIIGIPSASGGAFRLFDIELALNWFRDHMPQEWTDRTDAVANGYVDAWDQCLREWVYDESGIVREEAVIYLLKQLEIITE